MGSLRDRMEADLEIGLATNSLRSCLRERAPRRITREEKSRSSRLDSQRMKQDLVMNTRELLADRIANHNLCPGAKDVDSWLSVHWVRFRIGETLVPLIPLWGLKKALVAHDAHHAIMGFSSTLRGEVEVASWEVASGGCGWNLPFWLDRLLLVLIGLAACPTAVCSALRSGWSCRNLFGMPIDVLLAADVDELKKRMRLY